MPTPSSPAAPESHSFASTCPDEQTPHSPSGWHSPRYLAAMDQGLSPEALPVDDGLTSRSTTMSPRPQSSGDEPTPGETESMLPPRESMDDSHKQTDTDEEMTGADHPGGGGRAPGGREISTAALVDGHIFSPSARRRHAKNSSSDIVSPISADGDKLDDAASISGIGWADDAGLSMGYEFSNLRVIPTSPSSFLRPGSRFTGTQQSERQVYDVQVEIKHVDLRESYLCGYLRIQGLTEDHPTLTTYFEGEIIGTKYSFMTKHESWGANERIDLSHWSKFGAFRQFAKQAKKGNVLIKDFAQKENIFMRWKEHFLVPDHRVRTINGASFEGFYYICFNQVEGRVSGIYFHSKSEKFQQLELKHVEDRGCFSAMEFR